MCRASLEGLGSPLGSLEPPFMPPFKKSIEVGLSISPRTDCRPFLVYGFGRTKLPLPGQDPSGASFLVGSLRCDSSPLVSARLAPWFPFRSRDSERRHDQHQPVFVNRLLGRLEEVLLQERSLGKGIGFLSINMNGWLGRDILRCETYSGDPQSCMPFWLKIGGSLISFFHGHRLAFALGVAGRNWGVRGGALSGTGALCRPVAHGGA